MAVIPSCTFLVGDSLPPTGTIPSSLALGAKAWSLLACTSYRSTGTRRTSVSLSLSRICIRVGYTIRVVNVNHQRRGTRVLMPLQTKRLLSHTNQKIGLILENEIAVPTRRLRR